MSRTARYVACVASLLIMLISRACPASASLLSPTDENFASFTQSLKAVSQATPHPAQSLESSRIVSMATSHDADQTQVRDFMQQVTSITIPAWMQLILPQSPHQNTENDDAIQLIGQGPVVRGSGTTSLPMDWQWMVCCGDGTVLAAIDSSFRTLVNTNEHQARRSASLVSIAKTGTALPLSFEVSRRVRAQSVPEPTSLSVLSLTGLLLLRRPRRSVHRI